MKLKKYIGFVNEKFGVSIQICEKSKETYGFILKYLNNIISFGGYMDNENLYQVCAYDNSELIGIRLFRMKDRKVHLNYSVVSESHRNMGINKKMAEKIFEISENNGVELITSNVRESNIYSIKSLLSSGFQINDKVVRYYDDGEKKISLFKECKSYD